MAQPKRPDLLLLVSHNLHDVTMTNREEAKSNAVRDDLSQGSGGGRDRPAAASQLGDVSGCCRGLTERVLKAAVPWCARDSE